MSTDQSGRMFRRGLVDGAPFNLASIPFSLLFGVVAVEAGFDMAQVMGMSFIVIAGASSLTAIQLLGDQAPALMAVLAGAAVNLRMAMYSASLAPHISDGPLLWRLGAAYFLVDHVYAMALRDYQTTPRAMREKFAYFFGLALSVCPFWYLFCWLGALLGEAIPPDWPLDFAGAIMFTALVAPMIRGAPALIAAGVASLTALAASGLPFSLGLLVGGVAGMVAGAAAELGLERRNA
ncbi:AzlC family ABC transporter permease [Pikeienuella sp. HZG-20]|uniref:AzlC family ABC transporter permease n=1 Tax=Paludibacillus litoralis TaxID=3133267 RepID=UPI0030EC3028